MRIVRSLVLAVLCGSIPMAAGADVIGVGDMMRFSDGWGNAGAGEFLLTDVSKPAGSIIRLCLQMTEDMNCSDEFIVGGINPHTMPDGDSILSQTVGLYAQFNDRKLMNDIYAVGNGVFATGQIPANGSQHNAHNHRAAAAQDRRTHQVPEPATLALMGVGILGMSLARRRRKA